MTGGFPLGAYWAGIEFNAHYFSEVDPWAVGLYQKRFPDAIPLGDIREIDGKALADTDSIIGGSKYHTERQPRYSESIPRNVGDWIITGGFPCVDVSYAGKGAGLEGAQSGLWYEMHRIIGELRPRLVIVENVSAFYTRGLDSVLGSLAEIGYDAEWETIQASDVGAPHKKARIWIVAYPSQLRCDTGGTEQPLQGAGAHGETQWGMAYSEVIAERSGFREGEQGKQRGRRFGDGGGKGSTGSDRTIIRGLGGDSSRLSPWMDGWEDGVPRLAVEQPDRVNRLKGIGNSIVPQIAELLFRQLKDTGWI